MRFKWLLVKISSSVHIMTANKWGTAKNILGKEHDVDSDQNDQKFFNQSYWAELVKPLNTWSISTGMDLNIYGDNFSDENQMPLGIQLVGKFGRDRQLLSTASWAEAALKN